MKMGVFVFLALLAGCGSEDSTPVTTATIVNNSDIDINQLYVTLNSDTLNSTQYLIEFVPPILPGYSQSIDVDPSHCNVNLMVEIQSTGIFDQASYGHTIACGSSDFECGFSRYYDSTFNVMRSVTSCGTYGIPLLPTIPVAEAGSNRVITTGDLINLDASASYDVGGDSLFYEWSFLAAPIGSSAIISNQFSVNTSFFSDVDGVYNISLVVTDPGGSSNTDQVAIVSIPSGFITLGSHKDDVLLVQGTPTAINNTFSLGYYEWSYGTGTDIRFSTDDDRVIAWDNDNGSLLVTMVQGNNVTNSSFISLGSHQDDVIRIQGTPIAIRNTFSLGYYEWEYGLFTTIRFSTSDASVIAWNNYDGSLILQ